MEEIKAFEKNKVNLKRFRVLWWWSSKYFEFNIMYSLIDNKTLLKNQKRSILPENYEMQNIITLISLFKKKIFLGYDQLFLQVIFLVL